MDIYEETLLSGWEDVYKKGQLTLWILLSLKDSPKHMADIKAFIANKTNDVVRADDKSLYRALRRYNGAGIIRSDAVKNNAGPDRKLYHLTATGSRVLNAFIERNITGTLFEPDIKNLLARKS